MCAPAGHVGLCSIKSGRVGFQTPSSLEGNAEEEEEEEEQEVEKEAPAENALKVREIMQPILWRVSSIDRFACKLVLFACIHAHTGTQAHTHLRTRTHMHTLTHMYKRMHTRTYAHTCGHKQRYTHAHIYTRRSLLSDYP